MNIGFDLEPEANEARFEIFAGGASMLPGSWICARFDDAFICPCSGAGEDDSSS